MGIGKNRSVRVGVAGLAVAATAVLTMPAVASAVPEESTPGTTTPGTTTPGTTTPGTTAPDSATTLPEIPGDAELADLVRRLKAEGGAEKAMEALTAILSSSGQLDPSKYLDSSTLLQSMGLDKLGLEQLGITLPGLSTTPEAPGTTTPGTTTPSTTTPGTTPNATTPGTSTPESSAPNATTPTTDAPANPLAPNPVDAPVTPSAVTPSAVTPSAVTPAVADALAALQKITGTTLLSPALSPLCATPTADNPLGLVTAPAVAVPGPWPTVKTNNNVDMLRGLADLLPADNDLLTAIDDDQTAFALVPPGEPGADKFRVAWFNTSTLKGGMADLKPLSEVAASSPLKQLLTATESFHGIRLARVQTGKGTILSAVFGTTTKAGRTCFFLPALGTVNNQ